MRGHWGPLEGVGGIQGLLGVSGGIRDLGVLGVYWAGRECRYSGARRDIGSIRGHWGLLGGVGVVRAIRWVSGDVRGVLGGWQGV